MAEQKKAPSPATSRKRRTVPVASRKAAAEQAAKHPSSARLRPGTVELGVLVMVLIIVLFTITVPLRNYFQGRSEITRLNETIASQQLEKERLLGEIEQYEDDSYLQEQARNRLGLIEPGETAFRIIDPRMDQNDTATTSQEELAAQRTWFEILWDSVATVPTIDSEDILVEE